MSRTSIDVEHLFTLTADLGDTSNAAIPDGPTGSRFIVPVTGGTFEGPKLKGTVTTPGGDWVHTRPDGSIHLDVRLLLVTDEGESILMTYQGIGTRGEDRVTHIRTAPTFETGAEGLAWLNNVQAVGVGTSGGGGVTYEIYRVL